MDGLIMEIYILAKVLGHKNYIELQILMNDFEYDIDIIALTEVWDMNIESYKNLFNGYKQYYKLSAKKVDGVCLYIKEDIEVEDIDTQENENLEQLWLKIK